MCHKLLLDVNFLTLTKKKKERKDECGATVKDGGLGRGRGPRWSTAPHTENISQLLRNSWRMRFIPLYIHRYISGRYTAECLLLRSRDFKRRLSRAKHKSPTLSLLLCVTGAKKRLPLPLARFSTQVPVLVLSEGSARLFPIPFAFQRNTPPLSLGLYHQIGAQRGKKLTS